MHPLTRTCKGPDILLELAYVGNIGSEEKIENFDNAWGRISSFKSTLLQTLDSNDL